MLGLRFCARAFSSCGKRGPLFITVRGPLTIAASLVAEHKLQMRRLSSCGSRAQPLHGMWDLPRPGLEPVCPALAGRFSTTAPPGKPQSDIKKFLDQVFVFYLFLLIHASIHLTFLKPNYVPITILSTVRIALKTIPAFFPSNGGRQTLKNNLHVQSWAGRLRAVVVGVGLSEGKFGSGAQICKGRRGKEI